MNTIALKLVQFLRIMLCFCKTLKVVLQVATLLVIVKFNKLLPNTFFVWYYQHQLAGFGLHQKSTFFRNLLIVSLPLHITWYLMMYHGADRIKIACHNIISIAVVDLFLCRKKSMRELVLLLGQFGHGIFLEVKYTQCFFSDIPRSLTN